MGRDSYEQPRSRWALREYAASLEAKVDALARRLATVEAQNRSLLALVCLLLSTREALIERLQCFARMLFGRSSERRSGLKEADDESQTVDAAATVSGEGNPIAPSANVSACNPPKRSRGAQFGHKGYGRRIPQHLPVEDRLHPLPESHCRCTRCGQPFRTLGEGADEVSYEVDVRIEYVLVCHRRHKYVRTCTCPHLPAVITAPPPAKLLPKGMLSVGTVVHLLIQKYLAHVPFARQVRLLGEQGLDLSPGTVAGYMKRVLALFRPLYDLLWERCRQEKHWQIDETSWRMFVEREGKQGHRWWMWIFTTQRITLFVLDPTRSSDVLLTYLDDTEGIATTDSYRAYDKAATKLNLTLHRCWAHVRRLLFPYLEANVADPVTRQWMRTRVEEIGALYAYHAERRRHSQGTPLWEAAQHGLKASFAAIEAAWRQVVASPQQSAHAVVRLANRLQRDWQALTLPLHQPHLPLDNNTAERRLRELVLERHTIPGTFSEWGGQLTAVIYSILQTCRQHGVNPTAFLRFYLRACLDQAGGQAARAPTDLEPFLPWNLRDWVPADKQVELFTASKPAVS